MAQYTIRAGVSHPAYVVEYVVVLEEALGEEAAVRLGADDFRRV